MIGRLTLSDFRNHADALIVPDHAFILLTGENGAGKTNILEAVSMLAPGRGLRGAALRDMVRQDGGGSFGIAAEVDGVMLGTGVLASAPDRRQVRIGGVSSSANALADHLAIVWLTPAMDRLFMDSPGGRRRFLDRLTLALHPGHAVHSARYEAAMRARNRLLGDLSAADPAWLSALEIQMDEHGAALSEARADLIARLSDALEGQPDHPFARPLLAIEGDEGQGQSLSPACPASVAAMPLPDAPCPGRTGRIWSSSTLPRGRPPRCVRPANRRRCCFRFCSLMPHWSRPIAASHLCCCSMKWRPISTRSDEPRCSIACATPAVRCG